MGRGLASEEGRCVWYDVCHEDTHFSQYCPVNHTAKLFPPNKYDVITENCPHLLEHMKDGKLNLCCNPKMVSWGPTECFKQISRPGIE